MSTLIQQNDIRVLQTVLKDLHNKLGTPSLSVSSWRYPERLATAIDVNEILSKTCGMTTEEHRILSLELLVDRLLLLLQTCIYDFESTSGQTPTSLPLSLSTSVKRFSRGFVQQSFKYKEVNKKVSDPPQPILKHEIPQPQVHMKTVSTQTIQTSITSCQKCPEIMQILTSLATNIQSLSNELSGRGQFVDTSRLDMGKLMVSIEKNLSNIKESYMSVMTQRENMATEIVSQQCHVSQLQEQNTRLNNTIVELQREVKSTQESCQNIITKSQECHSAQVVELNEELNDKVSKSERLQEDLTNLRKQESLLRLALKQKDNDLSSLKMSLENCAKEECHLKSIQNELECQLATLKTDHEKVSVELENKSLHLNKTTIRLHNFESKCQSLQTKQLSLLNQVDQLDMKCSHLNTLLSQSMTEKQSIESKLQDMTEKCEVIEDKLKKEKELVANMREEKLTLEDQSLKLKQELSDVQIQLKEEIKKTHLLMDYPFTEDSSTLTSTQFRHYINANTVRIQLLEEQSSELRQRLTYQDGERFILKEPIKLWQSLDKTGHKIKSQSHTREPHNYSAYPRSHSTGHRPEPNQRPLKGRLGHLVNAIASSQNLDQQTHSCTDDQTETHTDEYLIKTRSCSECDRLFCSLTELQEYN